MIVYTIPERDEWDMLYTGKFQYYVLTDHELKVLSLKQIMGAPLIPKLLKIKGNFKGQASNAVRINKVPYLLVKEDGVIKLRGY